MKKIITIILKSILGLVIILLVLLFTVPILFKGKIKIKVEEVINGSVNASVKFDDYKLGFFRNFPNLSFSLKNVSVMGVDKFNGDTLAGVRSFDLVFNLGSLLGKSGYEIKSITVDRAVVNAIVLKNGKANWDIMKPTGQSAAVPQTTATSTSSMKIRLEKVQVIGSSVSYIDSSSSMAAYLRKVDFVLRGDMTLSQTDLQTTFHAGEVTFIMDGVKYLNKAMADSKIDLTANLDSMKFTFRQNYLTLNNLKLNFSGTVAMPGKDVITNMSFGTEKTSFKTLLSLVPAIYMKDYKNLTATGDFSMSGLVKGVYSEADSTLPDVTLSFLVNNGLISYPSLPEKIQNINISAGIFCKREVYG